MHGLGAGLEIVGVDGRDAARECLAVGPDELDAVARSEVALDGRDADREQARAGLDDRAACTGIDADPAGNALAVSIIRKKSHVGSAAHNPATSPSSGTGTKLSSAVIKPNPIITGTSGSTMMLMTGLMSDARPNVWRMIGSVIR